MGSYSFPSKLSLVCLWVSEPHQVSYNEGVPHSPECVSWGHTHSRPSYEHPDQRPQE